MKKDIIITDKPANSKIFNDIIGILDKLTGTKWGYVKSKQRVKYITSEKIPLKVGIQWGKSYEKNIKYLFDINISNKTPAVFESYDIWRDAITTELQIGLLKLVHDNNIKNEISKWQPNGEFANILLEANEQNRKYPNCRGCSEQRAYDVWLDDCLQE